MTRAVPDAFADMVVGAPLQAVTIVSPWLTDAAGGCEAFDRVLTYAVSCRARLHIITREPASNESHRRAISAALAAGGRVTVNPLVHAKIFVAEFRNGSRVALVGSANFTAGSERMLETAVVVASPPSRRGPDTVDDLLFGPIRLFIRHDQSCHLHEI